MRRSRFLLGFLLVALVIAGGLSYVASSDPDGLDSVTLNIGGLRITPLVVLKTSVLMVLTVWVAVAASNFLDRRLRGFSDLTPSIQVLLSKLIRSTLLAFAIVIVLSSVGIDLSVLAVFDERRRSARA